jgi:hypothetical protein
MKKIMEPKIVRVGKYFINLNNLAVADIVESKTESGKQWVDLTFISTALRLRLTEDADPIIQFLESNSQDLSQE